MPPQKHSRFGPSSSGRWIPCPGSVGLQTYGKGSGSIYAAEGTLMHNISEDCLLNPDVAPGTFVGQTFNVDGYDIEFTQEFADAVQFYLDAVWNLKDDYPDSTLTVEERVNLGYYGKEFENIFGTADAIINQQFGVLVVADLKGGKGVSVAADSSQPKLYAVMAAGKLLETYEKIVTVIIQPRDRTGEYYKAAEHDPADLKAWVEDTVLPAIRNGRSDNPTFCASEAACRWCEASGQCKYQAELAFKVAVDDFDIDDLENTTEENLTARQTPPGLIEDDQFYKILELSKFIQDWVASVKTVAKEKLEKGQFLKKLKLVEGRSNRTWDPEQDIEKILKTKVRFKVSEIYEKKLRSPTQLMKIVPKKKKEMVEALIIKPKGKPTVAFESDKRPAIKPTKTADTDFEDIGGIFD